MKRVAVALLTLVLCLSAVLPVLPALPEQSAPLAPVAEAATYETAWWPAPAMNITQIAFESYSHGDQNALDFAPGGRVFAPFTGKVTYKNASWGFVVLQSTNKVYYADGTLDYMTACFMHDGDISNISVGQTIAQGTAFYDQGGMGSGNPNAYGYHVHMSIWQGQYNLNYVTGKGGYYAYKALAINTAKTTSIIKKGKMVSGNYMTNGAPSDYSNLWKTTTQVGGPPTSASVSTANKNSFAVNENVTFKMSSDGESNTLWIYKPDGSSTYYQNAGTSKTLTFSAAGKYQALVEAWNGQGSKQSSKITFYIGNPTSATIKTNKSSYTTAESVTFTMSSDGESNTLWVYKPDGSSTYYQNAGTSKSLTFSTPGKYEALVEAWNGNGSKCSSKVSFTVTQAAAPSKPTSASIKSDKSSYTVGENVVLTFSGNGETNTLWIYYPDGTSKYFQEAGTAKTMTFTAAGTYGALVETWNGQGSFCSSKITFTVQAAPSKPTSATIKSDKSSYTVGENVNLTFSGNGETNTLWIYYPDGTSKYFQEAGTAKTMTFTAAGTYGALVETWNGAGSFCSSKITFTVKAAPSKPTSATIKSDKTSYTVGESVKLTFSGNGDTNTVWIYYPDGSSQYFEKAGTSKTMTFSAPGTYQALVETWNGAGSFCSSKITFTVKAAATTTKATTTKATTTKATTTKATTTKATTTKATTTKATTTKATTTKATTTKATTTKATTTKPTTVTTTKATTTKPTTVTTKATTTQVTTTKATTTKVTTTKATTTKATTTKASTTRPTYNPTTPTVTYNCAVNGHDYLNGWCKVCREKNPDYVTPTVPTTLPTVPPTEPSATTEPVIGPTLMQSVTDPNQGGNQVETTTDNADAGKDRKKSSDEDDGGFIWWPLIIIVVLGAAGLTVMAVVLIKKK